MLIYVTPSIAFSLYAIRRGAVPGRRKDGQAGKYLFSFFKRQAVGALVYGRIGLVGTYGNGVQRAEILRLLMMLALINGAADGLVA